MVSFKYPFNKYRTSNFDPSIHPSIHLSMIALIAPSTTITDGVLRTPYLRPLKPSVCTKFYVSFVCQARNTLGQRRWQMNPSSATISTTTSDMDPEFTHPSISILQIFQYVSRGVAIAK